MEISFSMIFSIVIIVAILGVGFYVISKFINLSRCADIGLFYDDLQDRVDKAWASGITSDVYELKLSFGIEKLCFGNLSYDFKGYEAEHEFLNNYKRLARNVFIYPTKAACDSELATYDLKHADTQDKKFFCVDVIDNKIKIKISKKELDALVQIGK